MSTSRTEERPSRSRLAFLRHPLVVGAAVAIVSAVFASLLIPSITQVAQDRPKELELKRTIVEGIASATASALNKGVALGRGDLIAAGGEAGEAQLTVYRRVYGDWLVAKSTLDAQVTTYFSQGDASSREAWSNWRDFQKGISQFLQLSTLDDPNLNVRRRARDYLAERLRPYTSDDMARRLFQGVFGDPDTLLRTASTRYVIRSLAELLEFDRDAVTIKIVEAPATGFRHSPWSLGAVVYGLVP